MAGPKRVLRRHQGNPAVPDGADARLLPCAARPTSFRDNSPSCTAPGTTTYRQFEERVNRLANGLRALGLRHPGPRGGDPAQHAAMLDNPLRGAWPPGS